MNVPEMLHLVEKHATKCAGALEWRHALYRPGQVLYRLHCAVCGPLGPQFLAPGPAPPPAAPVSAPRTP